MTRTTFRNSLVAAVVLPCLLAGAAIVIGSRGSMFVTSTFGGFTLVQSADAGDGSPAVADGSARATALAAAAARQPALQGLTVASSRFAGGLLQASDSSGSMRFTQDTPTDSWIVELTGPPQLGWKHFAGVIIVDADTGLVEATSLLLYN